MFLNKKYYNLFLNLVVLAIYVQCEYVKVKCLYERLGISQDASETEIKRAYRKKAAVKHPDKNRDNPDATEEFQDLNEAAEVLMNEKTRKLYNKCGMDCVKREGAGGHHDHGDIFSNFFGDFGFGFGDERGPREAAKGATITMDLFVTLEELYSGKFVEVRGTADNNVNDQFVTTVYRILIDVSY